MIMISTIHTQMMIKISLECLRMKMKFLQSNYHNKNRDLKPLIRKKTKKQTEKMDEINKEEKIMNKYK